MKPLIFLASLLLMVSTSAHADRKLPVDGGTITSGIGWRLDPFGSGRMVYHAGIDVSVPEGTPVYPTKAGVVIFAGPYGGYGNMVAVDHGGGIVTLYGHNASVAVRQGQKVTTATVIAHSGSTGRSTGPHVHYEVRNLGVRKLTPEQMEAKLKETVKDTIDEWIEDFVTGKGGPEMSLPIPLPTGALNGRSAPPPRRD